MLISKIKSSVIGLPSKTSGKMKIFTMHNTPESTANAWRTGTSVMADVEEA